MLHKVKWESQSQELAVPSLLFGRYLPIHQPLLLLKPSEKKQNNKKALGAGAFLLSPPACWALWNKVLHKDNATTPQNGKTRPFFFFPIFFSTQGG
jgi:hypothetical protein